MPMEQAVEILLNHGVLGIVVLVMGVYVRELNRERQQQASLVVEQTEKRTQDAKTVAATMLEIAEKHAQEREQIRILLTEVTVTLSALDTSLRELKQEVSE